MSSNTTTAFDAYFSKLQIFPDISQRILSINNLIYQQISTKSLPFSDQPGDIQTLLFNNQQAFEEKLRRQRMKEAKETKKELEKKLDFLNLELSMISARDNNQNSPFPSKKAKLEERDKNIQISLKKVTKEWQLLQEKRTERMNKMIEDSRKEEEMLRNQEKNEQERVKNEKLQRVATEIQKIQARMKQRETVLPKEKEELKALLKNTPKAIRQAELSREREKLEEEQRISEKLALIKEKHKPIDKAELLNHSKQHDEQMKLRQRAKADEKSKSQREAPFKPSYKSHLHVIIEQEDLLKTSKIQEESAKRHETLQKMKDFQQKIKSEHQPEVDIRKKQSLEDKIFKLKHPAFKFFVPKDHALTEEDVVAYNLASEEKNPQKIGKSYLEFAKLHKKMHPNSRSLEKLSSEPDKSVLKTSKYENYLKKPLPLGKKSDFMTILNNTSLSQMEKREQVFAKAEVLEDEAIRKEQLMKVKGNHQLNVEADELRVKAMMAKLEFLKGNE